MNWNAPDRRSFLAGSAAAVAAAATSLAAERDYRKNALPARYPDPDIVVLDKRFAKYKIGNSAIEEEILRLADTPPSRSRPELSCRENHGLQSPDRENGPFRRKADQILFCV